MRTIKWLKEQIQNFPDDAHIDLDKEEMWVHSDGAIHLITAWTQAADLSADSLETLDIEIRKSREFEECPATLKAPTEASKAHIAKYTHTVVSQPADK